MPSVPAKTKFNVPIGTTQTWNIPIALVETDVVVVMATRRWSTPMPIVTGLNGPNSWVQVKDLQWVRNNHMEFKTGASGMQSVSVQNTQPTVDFHVNILVLRGLNQPILGGIESATISTAVPSQPYSDGCIAVIFVAVQSAASDYTVLPSPTTDWVDDAVYADTAGNPYVFVKHHIGLVPGTVSTNSAGSASGNGSMVAVFGQPIIPVPFRGWGMKL